jgi:hypothetical protein
LLQTVVGDKIVDAAKDYADKALDYVGSKVSGNKFLKPIHSGFSNEMSTALSLRPQQTYADDVKSFIGKRTVADAGMPDMAPAMQKRARIADYSAGPGDGNIVQDMARNLPFLKQ